MPAQDAHIAGRWTATRPDEETRPVGPDECLLRALAKLGPFKHRLHDDADRLGPWEGLGGRVALSEQLAFERIWILTTSLNKEERLSQGAPRTKDVVERLTKLETLAGELARHMKSLDDITRHRLQTAGSGVNGFGDVIYVPLMEDADVAGLPMPNEENVYGIADGWVSRLEALSSYANDTLNMFLHSKGISSADAADKGGNTNLHKALHGSARWGFVTEGWHLYELFKPGKATGTEGGPFHLFLLDVFEYATGLDPEEHSKLTYWLKRVSKVNRQHQQITDRKIELIEKSYALPDDESKISAEESDKRMKDICEEQRALEKERYDLWPSLFPFSYPQPKPRQ